MASPAATSSGRRGYALAAGVLEPCGFLFFFRALQKGDLAVVAPIIGLEGGIAALTVFAFGERVSAIVVLGLAIALLGGCLAASACGRRTAAGALPAAGAAVLSAPCSRSTPPPKISDRSRSWGRAA